MAAGIGKPMIGKFYVYNALEAFHKTIDVERNPDCPLCGTKPTIREIQADTEGTTCR
jgi:hypothetical protein